MKTFLSIVLLIVPIILLAQDDMYIGSPKDIDTNCLTTKFDRKTFNDKNSVRRTAMALYKITNGYYSIIKDKSVNIVDVEDIYAYDKDLKTIYATSSNGNYEIVLTKDFAKLIKKDKTIPHLSGDKLRSEIMLHNELLAQRFNILNAKIKDANDSLAQMMKEIKYKRETDNKIKITNYRKLHKWNMMPIDNNPLLCSICNEVTKADSVYIVSMGNDTIVYVTLKDFPLNKKVMILHKARIPYELKDNETFNLHCNVFKDSLEANNMIFDDWAIGYMNSVSIDNFEKAVKKEAPYGYVESWGWDDEYGMITFDFTYTNTNKRTIKYIEVYWSVKNDVNDIRGRGKFGCTGPVKEHESGRWKWDHSSYFVKGDVTRMNINKIVIKYMDGGIKTLTGSSIKFN